GGGGGGREDDGARCGEEGRGGVGAGGLAGAGGGAGGGAAARKPPIRWRAQRLARRRSFQRAIWNQDSGRSRATMPRGMAGGNRTRAPSGCGLFSLSGLAIKPPPLYSSAPGPRNTRRVDGLETHPPPDYYTI